jgi:hypothetical protein
MVRKSIKLKLELKLFLKCSSYLKINRQGKLVYQKVSVGVLLIRVNRFLDATLEISSEVVFVAFSV